MPTHHYLFAHKVLPSVLWEGDSMLGILANPENQEYLTTIWNKVPLSTGQLPAILPPDGLGYSSHWIGGEHLVFLVQMPPPIRQPEAYFVCITSSPEIQYFTLEKSRADDGSECTAFCSWTAERHYNFGWGPEPVKEAFLKKLCVHFGLPEAIEEPTPEQLQGMGKGRMTVYVAAAEPLPETDGQQAAQWEDEAEKAMSAGDLLKAEDMYRRVLELRMRKQGPHDTEATLARMPLVQVLDFQGRHQEAEALCREWWHTCRRFRMLGHQETMLATKVLGHFLLARNRVQEASELMRYRIQMAGLARGKDSVQAQEARADMQHFESSVWAAVHPAIGTSPTQKPAKRAWWQFWR